MDRQDYARTVRYATPEPLELIGVGVGRRHLDGGRQVENEPIRGRRLDDVLDRLADLEGEIELGASKTLRRIFELEVRARGRGRQRLDLLGGIDRNLGHALAIGPEDDFALQG